MKSMGRPDLHKSELSPAESLASRNPAVELPVITSCDDCGACCLDQGAPPDYVALSLNPHLASDASFAEDLHRLERLPDEPRRLLTLYLEETAAGLRDRIGPCLWFNAVKKHCSFYDWRPSTCRVFETDSPGCHIYRGRHGVD